MNLMKWIVFALSVLGLSILALADVPPQKDSVGSHAVEASAKCKECMLVSAFDRYFYVPTRYVIQVQRRVADRCIVLRAPRPAFGNEIGSSEYAQELEKKSGLIRFCPQEVVQEEIQSIERKAKPTSIRVEGDVTIRAWSSAALQSKFTLTLFSRGAEVMLISDIDPKFSEALWSGARSLH
jgi:hypothetical protein